VRTRGVTHERLRSLSRSVELEKDLSVCRCITHNNVCAVVATIDDQHENTSSVREKPNKGTQAPLIIARMGRYAC
jgi:hypothetical protein